MHGVMTKAPFLRLCLLHWVGWELRTRCCLSWNLELSVGARQIGKYSKNKNTHSSFCIPMEASFFLIFYHCLEPLIDFVHKILLCEAPQPLELPYGDFLCSLFCFDLSPNKVRNNNTKSLFLLSSSRLKWWNCPMLCGWCLNAGCWLLKKGWHWVLSVFDSQQNKHVVIKLFS